MVGKELNTLWKPVKIKASASINYLRMHDLMYSNYSHVRTILREFVGGADGKHAIILLFTAM